MNNSMREMIFNTLLDLIESDYDVVLEYKGKINRIRFSPNEFLPIPKLGDNSWDGTDHIILFEIENRKDKLDILLVIGPGNSEMRQSILDIALKNQEIFNTANCNLSPIFKRIFRLTLLDFNKDTIQEENLVNTVQLLYNDFKRNQYKQITTHIQNNLIDLPI